MLVRRELGRRSEDQGAERMVRSIEPNNEELSVVAAWLPESSAHRSNARRRGADASPAA